MFLKQLLTIYFRKILTLFPIKRYQNINFFSLKIFIKRNLRTFVNFFFFLKKLKTKRAVATSHVDNKVRKNLWSFDTR